MPGVSGVSLAEISVPSSFIGRSCADLDLRNSYGVTVLLVKGGSGGEQKMAGKAPDARYVFTSEDVFLAMGSPASLNKLRGLL